MILIKSPNEKRSLVPPRTKMFLAGSIEMGKAEKWQERVALEFSNFSDELMIFDPRRDDWDSSWSQNPTPGTQFHTQVMWELKKLGESDIVLFYFDPKTQSPITLLELGVCLNSKKKLVVCCPDGYFRKGNVVITASVFKVPVLNTFAEMIATTRKLL